MALISNTLRFLVHQNFATASYLQKEKIQVEQEHLDQNDILQRMYKPVLFAVTLCFN